MNISSGDLTRSIRRGNQSLVLGATALLLILAGSYLVSIIKDQRVAAVDVQRAEAHQLQIALEDEINTVRGYLFSIRRGVEHDLVRRARASQGADSSSAVLSVNDTELGSLLTDKDIDREAPEFQRILGAARQLVPLAATNHQWYHFLQWTYFYGRDGNWLLAYPDLTETDLLRSTRAPDLRSAFAVVFEGGGTRPLVVVGPKQNPGRDMIWTTPYIDTAGKGLMVTLLAPIYLADEFIGAVGVDITLNELTNVLQAHAPGLGDVLVEDGEGFLIAGTGPYAGNSDIVTKVADLMPVAGAEHSLVSPLVGTNWTLRLVTPRSRLEGAIWDQIAPYAAMTLILLLGILGLGAWQNRRYAQPALKLAEYVERSQTGTHLDLSSVPSIWWPLFERVASNSRQRNELTTRLQNQNQELEARVGERTQELEDANQRLQATITSLQNSQRDLVRSEKLGMLGGSIASVSSELDLPLAQVERATSGLVGHLTAFQAQIEAGLRKTELQNFVVLVDQAAHLAEERVANVRSRLQHFKQLALAQTDETARFFSPAEVASNILAVMDAPIRRAGSAIRNEISSELEVFGNPASFGQLLRYLIEDAIQRSGQGAEISMNAAVESLDDGEFLTLRISPMNGSAFVVNGSADTSAYSMASLLIREGLSGRIEVADRDIVVQLPVPA